MKPSDAGFSANFTGFPMDMIEVKTAELEGLALDWIVDATVSGKPLEVFKHKDGSGQWMFFADGVPFMNGPVKFSTDLGQGHGLMDAEGIDRWCNVPSSIASQHEGWLPSWRACYTRCGYRTEPMHGQTPLIAGMRAYVLSKHGETVKVPAEVLAASKKDR
jgi:hypothetical protein